jgi:TRAP-type C4-dicarboxylate transport system permease small subunit
MGGLRARVAGLDAAVGRAEGWALGALVAAMTVTSFLQVVCRYVLNSPLVWSEELARYLFVWIGLVGAGAAVRTGGHFGLDLLYRRLPPAARPWVGGLVFGVVAVFAATLFVQGLRETAQASLQWASSLPFRMHWAYAAIPVGSGLMLWHLVARCVRAGFGANPLDPH